MPTNLELKIKVSSFSPFVKILKDIGADFKGTLNQKDIYYSVTTGLLKLRLEDGNSSLIYYRREENKRNRWSDFEFLKFSDKNAEKFLNKIFNIEAVVEKKRKLYLYNDTRIHLDDVKSLGYFLELETILTGSRADAKKRFSEIVRVLGLDTGKQIKKSYRDLLIEKKNKK